MAQTTVAINLEAKTKGTESVKSLKTQIKEATQDAAKMAQKFGEFSPQAIAAAKRVAELKDQMQDLQQRVQALNPDKFEAIGKVVGGVASGFSAAQGAMALFGAESEDVQKALLKVQGAMALAQGMQGLLDAGKQFKALGQSAVGAFNSMTTASKAFLATGLGLIISAIAYVVANFDELAESLGFAESEMSKMNKAMNMAAAETKIQADELNFYNDVVQDTTKSEGEREYALEQLKKAGIATDDVNLANANSLQALNNRVKDNIALIAQRARVEASAQILQEKTKKLIEMQSGSLDDATTTWDKFYVAVTTNLFNQDSIETRLRERANKNVKEQQKLVEQATVANQKELDAALKLEGKNKAAQDQILSTLKLREEAQKKADKAAQASAAKQAELQKRSAELLAQEELVGKTEVEKAKILAERKFKASTEGFKEGSKEYLAAQKIFNEEVAKIDADAAAKQKAKDEEDAKELATWTKEKQDEEIAALNEYYKKLETTAIANAKSETELNASLDTLQLQRLQNERQILIDQGKSIVDIENQIAAKKKEIYDKDVEAKKNAEQQKIELTKGGFQAIGELVTAFAGSSEEAQRTAFEINKAASIAMAIIDTYVAAQGAYKSQMAIATPDAPVRASIAAGIAIAQGLARVATIKKTQFQSKSAAGGGGGGGGTPPAPSMTPTQGGALPDEQQFGGMGRVYVLEGDITKTQTRVRRLRNTSVV